MADEPPEHIAPRFEDISIGTATAVASAPTAELAPPYSVDPEGQHVPQTPMLYPALDDLAPTAVYTTIRAWLQAQKQADKAAMGEPALVTAAAAVSASAATSVLPLEAAAGPTLAELLDTPLAPYVSPFLDGSQNSLAPLPSPDPDFAALVDEYFAAALAAEASWSAIEAYKAELRTKANAVWTTSSLTVSPQARCGDGKLLTTSFTYDRADYSHEAASAVATDLAALRAEWSTSLNLAIFKLSLTSMRVDVCVTRALAAAADQAAVPPHSPPALLDSSPLPHALRSRLLAMLSVLFSYEQKALGKVGTYTAQLSDTLRSWILAIGGMLLRVGDVGIHSALLEMLLRCRGVADWGVVLLQFPPLPWNDAILHHFVATLTRLLNPVVADAEARPVLSESDFLALLEQMPFGNLFCHLMFAARHLDFPSYTEHVFALSTFLLDTTCSSLAALAEYPSLGARLGAILVALVKFWEVYSVVAASSSLWSPRLTSHLDRFYLLTLHRVLATPGSRARRFLPLLPAVELSQTTAWHAFLVLYLELDPSHMSLVANISSHGQWLAALDAYPELRATFMRSFDTEDELNSSRAVFTLAAVGALAKRPDHPVLTSIVVTELFHVAYLHPPTRDVLHKPVRGILSEIAFVHPHTVLPSLLAAIATHLSALGPMALSLVRGLPLGAWSSFDLSHLAHLEPWLLDAPVDSVRFRLAAAILENLPWGFAREPDTRVRTPILPFALHRAAGLLAFQLYASHVLTSRSGPLKSTKASRAAVEAFVLRFISCLALFVDTDIDPSLHFLEPSLTPRLEWTGDIKSNADAAAPIRNMALFLFTGSGASSAAFANGGLEFIHAVANAHYPGSVGVSSWPPHSLSLLSLILDKILASSIVDDPSAAILLAQHWPVPVGLPDRCLPAHVTRLLAALLTAHAVAGAGAPASADARLLPHVIFPFWAAVLTQAPDWFTAASPRRALMNVLSHAALVMGVSDTLVGAYSAATATVNAAAPSTMSKIGSFFGGLIGSEAKSRSLLATNANATLSNDILTPHSLDVDCPALIFDVLYIETLAFLGKLDELGAQLVAAGPGAAHRVLKSAGYSRTMCTLPIYKWAAYAVALPVGSTLHPLFLHMFFALYAASSGVHDAAFAGYANYGALFFDELSIPAPFLNLKTQVATLLVALVNHHQTLETPLAPQLVEIYTAMSEWLASPALASLFTTAAANTGGTLDARFLPDRLVALVLRSPLVDRSYLWRDLVDLQAGFVSLARGASVWLRIHPRCWTVPEAAVETPLEPVARAFERADPHPRGFAFSPSVNLGEVLLGINTARVAEPAPLAARPVLEPAPPSVDSMLYMLNPLVAQARAHSTRETDYLLLDDEYLRLLPQLYVNEPRERHELKSCSGSGKNACRQPVRFVVPYTERVMQNGVSDSIVRNRTRVNELIAASGTAPDTCIQALRVLLAVEELVAASAVQTKVGSALLDGLLALISPDTVRYPPLAYYFGLVLSRLSPAFWRADPDATTGLLDTALHAPYAIPIYAHVFDPYRAPHALTAMLDTLFTAARTLGYDAVSPLLAAFNGAPRCAPPYQLFPREQGEGMLVRIVGEVDTVLGVQDQIVGLEAAATALVAVFEWILTAHGLAASGDIVPFVLPQLLGISPQGATRLLAALAQVPLPTHATELARIFGTLTEHFWAVRNSTRLFDIYHEPYVAALGQFVSALVAAAAAAAGPGVASEYAGFTGANAARPLLDLWHGVAGLWQPFLCSMPSPDDAGAPAQQPFDLAAHTGECLAAMEALRGSIDALTSHEACAGELLASVFEWYVRALVPFSEPGTRVLFDDVLGSLAWRRWQLDSAGLARLVSMVTPNAAGLFLRVLPQVLPPILMTSPAMPISTVRETSVALALAVRHAPLPIPRDAVALLASTAEWQELPPEAYRMMVDAVPLVLDAAIAPLVVDAPSVETSVTSEAGRISLILGLWRVLARESPAKLAVLNGAAMAAVLSGSGVDTGFNSAQHPSLVGELLGLVGARIDSASTDDVHAMLSSLVEMHNFASPNCADELLRTFVSFASMHPSAASAMVAVASSRLASVEAMVGLVEASLAAADGAGHQIQSLASNVRVPELAADAFTAACVAACAGFTLVCVLEQQRNKAQAAHNGCEWFRAMTVEAGNERAAVALVLKVLELAPTFEVVAAIGSALADATRVKQGLFARMAKKVGLRRSDKAPAAWFTALSRGFGLWTVLRTRNAAEPDLARELKDFRELGRKKTYAHLKFALDSVIELVEGDGEASPEPGAST
ncbi:uncharacterized protein AMSG_04576 [Thecamonas trahens ATCC 50062]|uniref:Epg5-like TPR domain-containing protein n=1 Tax=Thecamonas trahens ATCC 50062 TaxID=461836 RepID=A0A0L0D9R7_THETB|nr:hypothetical protein AMSG_04576 [Thecamonas trahens ATCC 50062]KNC48831.1 hypothetical protein AMSG_04576 [Thecamonas trahens ATCC 50062]|eukprot:XP_013758251.1 hypothetical protein AMSG_04576 [Thecamonas trahens ATCC 50062]